MRTPRPLAAAAVLLAAALALAACEDSKDDILQKAEKVSDKASLRAELGDPDDVSKLGPLETWTYRAKDGEVTFVITGDAVALKTAGDGDRAKSE